MRRRTSCLALFVALLGLPSVVTAQTTPVLAVSGGGTGFVDGGLTIGWEFTVTTPVLVAELGIYDDSPADPLNQSHQVGLWASNGTLLAATTVPPDAPVRGNFRYVPIEPILLPSAAGYALGAHYTDTPPADGFKGFATQTTIPQVTFSKALQNNENAFTRPTADQSAYNAGFFGPSFTVIERQMPVLAFSGGSPLGVVGPGTLGWEFDVTSPVLVAELGVHDATPGDPLNQSHQVGLWDPAGILLAEVTVPVDAPLRSGFRYVPIDPTLLPAAGGYRIGGVFDTTPLLSDAPTVLTTPTTLPQITFKAAMQSATLGFFRPTLTQNIWNAGVFGPSFTVIERQAPALTFSGGVPVDATQPITVGWEFDVATPVLVTELGIHDPTPEGALLQSHATGIWDPGGTLLVQTTVPVDAPLHAGFRSVPIDPIVLPSGVGYRIGALFDFSAGTHDLPRIMATSTTIPQVTYQRGMQSEVEGFVRPTLDLTGFGFNDGVFGPGFTAIDPNLVFADGFESGLTFAWSVTVP